MNDSTSSTEQAADLLPRLIAIARRAGAEILRIYAQDDLGERKKSDASPLTLADLAAHHAIMQGLQRLTPDIPLLSEEEAGIPYAGREQWRRFWLVDPLDGTKEFIKRNGQFTVNIALIEQGRPVLGVVYAPALGQMYYGSIPGGAWKQSGEAAPESIRVATHGASGLLRIVASRSHSDAQTEAFLQRIGAHELAPTGSSLKFCLMAEGAADVYPRFGPTMEWDTAAAQCVVEAAGGIVCDFAGNPLRYNKPDLHNPPFLVTRPELKAGMLANIRI